MRTAAEQKPYSCEVWCPCKCDRTGCGCHQPWPGHKPSIEPKPKEKP